MKNKIQIFGEIGWEVTLDTVMKQVANTDENETLIVEIHSGGGSVIEGIAIYNYLKNLDREVQTESVGMVASIATIIWLAGTKRTLNSLSSFLIHQPFNWAEGTADDIQKAADELKKFENTLAEIYANETDLTKEEAIEKMKLDEFAEIDFLLDKKFVTDVIEFAAVASFKGFKNKKTLTKKKKKMAKTKLTEKQKNSFLAKFSKLGKTIENLLGIENKMVADANGEEINFPDIEDDATPDVGDKAEVDGKAIEDGKRVMPDGEIWEFLDGKLDKKTPKENEDSADDSDEVVDLKQEIVDLKKTNTDLQAKFDGKENELKNEISKNKTALNEIKNDMAAISGALGSDFKFENNEQPKKVDENGNRVFVINKKK